MSIVKDLRETNIKCYDKDNLIFIDTDNILKLNGNSKDLLLDVIGNSLNVSDNAKAMYKVISHSLPRKGMLDVNDVITATNKELNKTNITSIRALKELVINGVVRYCDTDKKYITLTIPYNITDYLNKDIKYIIIENVKK